MSLSVKRTLRITTETDYYYYYLRNNNNNQL
jgi:hypothetical protein